ncbi:endonuclease [Candidatus Palauibacter sp.]|uniref:endonuclease n=1 Tax=Candidatus Palauibacter sp. TaxID=3101350 RepID=UPI003AF21119
MIEKVFFDHYAQGLTEFEFQREELEDAVAALGVARVKNLGDITYSFRYRNPLPDSILETQPEGHEWIIEGAGKGLYRFKLVTTSSRILPREDLVVIDIPDATPELIRAYKLDDEQALLAMVRYNRLIDTFLGLTAYSLQNHLRTTVKDLGQIEIDELYIGIDKLGCHYVIPVQAKGEKDQIGIVQTTQDIRFAEQKFPGMRCRAIAAQFLDNDVVALFELTLQASEIKVVEERHYRLVPAEQLDSGSDQKLSPVAKSSAIGLRTPLLTACLTIRTGRHAPHPRGHSQGRGRSGPARHRKPAPHRPVGPRHLPARARHDERRMDGVRRHLRRMDRDAHRYTHAPNCGG